MPSEETIKELEEELARVERGSSRESAAKIQALIKRIEAHTKLHAFKLMADDPICAFFASPQTVPVLVALLAVFGAVTSAFILKVSYDENFRTQKIITAMTATTNDDANARLKYLYDHQFLTDPKPDAPPLTSARR